MSQIFLNIATTYETFQKSGDQDSFRHKLKNSANTYESSGSVFSAELPLEQKENKKCLSNQNWLWLYLTNLGVREILCSFSLVLEGKAGKEMPNYQD